MKKYNVSATRMLGNGRYEKKYKIFFPHKYYEIKILDDYRDKDGRNTYGKLSLYVNQFNIEKEVFESRPLIIAASNSDIFEEILMVIINNEMVK